ncbi:MAG: hypothetical protein KGZ35_02830 [Truepera sp.]|nr:hypothetical protein [Truepera sp.]
MSAPRIYADFHNADSLGRLRLNSVGTVQDLSRQRVTLRDGLQLTLYSEDLEVDGEVRFADGEGLWVAVIAWDAIREPEPAEPLETPEELSRSA